MCLCSKKAYIINLVIILCHLGHSKLEIPNKSYNKLQIVSSNSLVARYAICMDERTLK